MGVVYKAYHSGLKRTVALKVLIGGEDASAEAIRRFHHEAEAIAKLGHHPNIVPVYDMGQEGERHYFAMHFVEGQSLDKRIRNGLVSPRKGAAIARDIASALHHAHGNGVLHRDVKPGNILVTKDGTPQITDFGLARDVEAEARVTRSGYTLGTPQYMPPEQAEGRLDHIDARSDVYGLGATLYEMLTGQPPFQGATAIHVLKKAVYDLPAPPRRLNPGVPKPLETICMKALSKKRRARYATAEVFGEDLNSFLKGDPVSARPPGLAESMVRRVRRHRVSLLLVFGLILLAGLGAAWIAYEALRPGTLLLHVRAPNVPGLTVDGTPAVPQEEGEPGGGWVVGPLKLSRGRHRLEARLPEHDLLDREFEIQGGRTLDLTVELVRATGTVSIFSSPENCELLLDGPEGTSRLMTPLADHPLPTGDYSVRVRKKNHFPQSLSLSVRAGEALPPRKVFLEGLDVWTCPLAGAKPGNAGVCRVADLDDDGADDLLVFREGSSLTCISGMWGKILWSRCGHWPLGKRCIGDFDGDERSEILLLEGGGPGKMRLICLGGADGMERWRREYAAAGRRERPRDQTFALSPDPMRIDDDGIDDFLLLRPGQLCAHSGSREEPLWTAQVGHPGLPLPGAKEGDQGFLMGFTNVTAFHVKKGGVLWQEELPAYVPPGNTLTPGDLDGDDVPDLIAWSETKVFMLSGGEKEILWDRNLGPPDTGGFYPDFFGGWSYLGGGTHTDWGVDRVKVVKNAEGGLDIVIHNRAHKNILTCVSGSAGTKNWDTVLPGLLRSMGDPIDLDGDGRFEIPMSLSGDRLALLEEGQGEAVRWLRTGIHIEAWRGAAMDFDRDGVLDLVVAGDDNQVQAFCGKTGKTLWAYQLDGRVGAFRCHRAGSDARTSTGLGLLSGDFEGSGYLDGLVVLTDRDILRLRYRPGETKWMAEIGGEGAVSYAGSDASTKIQAVTLDGRIIHIHPGDGRRLSQVQLKLRGESIREIRLADWDCDDHLDAYLFDTGGQDVFVVSGRNGAALQSYNIPVGGEVRCIEDMAGDSKPEFLVVQETDASLHCLCGQTRERLWSHVPEGPVWMNAILSLGLMDLDGLKGPEIVAAVRDTTPEGSESRTIITSIGPWGEWVTEEYVGGREWIGLAIRNGRTGALMGKVEVGRIGSFPRFFGPFPGSEGRYRVLLGSTAEVAACTVDGEKLRKPLKEGEKPPTVGKVLWRFPVRGDVRAVFPDPASPPEEPRILVADSTGDLFCLGLQSGKRIWASRLGHPIQGLEHRPGMKDHPGELLVLGQRTVSLLSLDGSKIVWETTLPEAVSRSAPGFRHLYDLDGDGRMDLTLPLAGGRIVGILPGRKPFRIREIRFDVKARAGMGAHLVAAGRHEGALKWLDEVIAEKNTPPAVQAGAFHARGKALLGLKKSEEALTAFTKSLELAPGEGQVRLERGLLYMQMKKDREAEMDLSGALAAPSLSPPGRFQALEARARVRRRCGDFMGAIDDFSEYLKGQPNAWRTILERAETYREAGQWNRVIEECEKWNKRNRWDYRSHVLLARAHARMGSDAEALKSLRTAIERGFMDVDALNTEEDFNSLRSLPEFNDLVETLEERKEEWERERKRRGW
jgi:tetratricopeptide (TPR) repeat protein